MGRAILAVVAGYAVMFVFVFSSFTIAYMALGAERTFRPGTFEPSSTWLAASIVLGLVAAILGGWVCAAVAPSPKAPLALAGLVFVLGLALAIPSLLGSAPDPGPRTGEVGTSEAISKTLQPAWIALLNPLIGAAGVWIGSRRRRPPG